jgi:transposase-like protein
MAARVWRPQSRLSIPEFCISAVVHKMRNIIEKVKSATTMPLRDTLKPSISPTLVRGATSLCTFSECWYPDYPVMVRQLERDLPELVAFYSFP